MSHPFNPARIDRLLSPDRSEWLQPERILTAMDLSPALRILDFGCGPGYFTLPLAAGMSDGGVTVAADMEPAMLHRLMERAREARTQRIFPVQCDHRLPFPDRSFDRILASLVYHELEDGHSVLLEFARILRAGASLALVEFQPGETEHGPNPAQRIAPAQLESGLLQAGLRPVHFVSISRDVYLQIAVV